MNILDLDKNSLLYMVRKFLHSDDSYAFLETCSYFYNTIHDYNKKKKENKNCKKRDLIPIKQPQPYHIVGSISMINWAKSHIGFKYCLRHSQFASRQDNIEVLRFLHAEKCPFGIHTWVEAAENENFEIIRWCYKKNIKFNYFVTSKAAEKGNVKLLKLLDSMNIDFNDDACYSAIYGGNLSTLKWLVQTKGLNYDNFSFGVAAEEGHLHILKYLYNITIHNLDYMGFFDETTCAMAAKGGKLNILKWLRLKQCNWDTSTTFYAARYKYKKVLEWCIENGCPIHESLFINLHSFGLQYTRDECNIVTILN